MSTVDLVLDAATFEQRVADRSLRVGIIGLGYAGLPLAMAFAEAGFHVVGVDLSHDRVEAVKTGRSYLVDVPAERYASAEGRLTATTDYAIVETLDALTICVPTPLNKTNAPDLQYVISAVESVGANLRPGQVVILQSTTYPGTTEEVVLPILEERSGGRVGEDFFLGYAPERVDPGNTKWTLRNVPKLVAGVTDECRRRTRLLYETVAGEVIPLSSTTVAETAKLHENTFRAVNIALANELALACDRMGISAKEVIDAAASKPFAFLPHYPGPGLGGDCIPVVPHFLSWKLRAYGYATRLIDTAHEINASMPPHVVERITDALNRQSLPVHGARILLLGMAYKPDVHDTRESPSLIIFRELLRRGAEAVFADPWVDHVVIDDEVHGAVPWEVDEVRRADCVVMLTHHSDFLTSPHWRDAAILVDTRNVVPDGPNVVRI